jgi:hypothetical protein
MSALIRQTLKLFISVLNLEFNKKISLVLVRSPRFSRIPQQCLSRGIKPGASREVEQVQGVTRPPQNSQERIIVGFMAWIELHRRK